MLLAAGQRAGEPGSTEGCAGVQKAAQHTGQRLQREHSIQREEVGWGLEGQNEAGLTGRSDARAGLYRVRVSQGGGA